MTRLADQNAAAPARAGTHHPGPADLVGLRLRVPDGGTSTMSMTNSHGPDALPGPRPASCGTRPTSSILWADPDDGRLPRVTSAVLRAARPLGRLPLSQRADLTRRCSPDSHAGAAPSTSFRQPRGGRRPQAFLAGSADDR